MVLITRGAVLGTVPRVTATSIPDGDLTTDGRTAALFVAVPAG